VNYLEYLAHFLPDPIKWADDLRSLLAYGRGHKLEWPKDSGMTGVAVERIANRYGIKTYCRDYGHGKETRGFRVPAAQAKWADYLLRKAGVPVTGRALSKGEPGPMPQEWGVPARGIGLAGALLDMWDPIRTKSQQRRNARRKGKWL
jgi:hypothetical protein